MRYFGKLSVAELRELRDKALDIAMNESIADLDARTKSANLAVLMMYNDGYRECVLVSPYPRHDFWSIRGKHVDPELGESLVKDELVEEWSRAPGRGIYQLSKKGRKTAAALRQYGFSGVE